MGRALIADPDLPNKLAANHDDAVIPCVGCNEGCVARLRERKAVACAVNPRTGCEGMYPRTHAAVSKHVAIVGGRASRDAGRAHSRRTGASGNPF